MKFGWIKEWDANTKLFHKLLSNRKNKSAIIRLEREDDMVLENKEAIEGEIISFYERLFKEEEASSWSFDGLDWNVIPEDKARWLERPFEEEEVKLAVFSSDKDKSLTAGFFQQCWGVVKGDLLKVVMV